FLRAALRVWVTDLRPPPTATAPGSGTLPPEKRLLLAELDVPLSPPAPGGAWTVANPAGVVINEERRPFLVPLRLLQGAAPRPGGAVSAGLALSRRGQPLALGQAVDGALVPAPAAATAGAGLFGDCEPPQPVLTGAGVYLLAVSPASAFDGRVPATSLTGLGT